MDGVTRAEVGPEIGLEISLSTLSASTMSATGPADGLSIELALPRAQAAPAAQAAPGAQAWDCYVEPLLSAYGEALRRGGSEAAAAIFAQPPVPSGIARVDTTIGILATYLADRDGWPVPGWAAGLADEAARGIGPATPWWFVSARRGPHASALMEAPPVFRRLRVFVTSDQLSR